MNRAVTYTAFALSGLANAVGTDLTTAPWMDVSKTPEARAGELIAEMELEEKLAMLHGIPNNVDGDVIYVGLVKGNPRLGIPQLRLNDGY